MQIVVSAPPRKWGQEAKEDMVVVCLEISGFMSLVPTTGNWDEHARKPQAGAQVPLLPPLLLNLPISYLIQNKILTTTTK